MTVTGTGLLSTFNFKVVPVGTNGCGQPDSSDAVNVNFGQSADPMGYFLTINMTLPYVGPYRACIRPTSSNHWVPLSAVIQSAGASSSQSCCLIFTPTFVD